MEPSIRVVTPTKTLARWTWLGVTMALLSVDSLLVFQRIEQAELVALYGISPYGLDTDFDGDGRPDKLEITDRELKVVSADGQLLLGTPVGTIDGTFRAQVAIRGDSPGPLRLLVFDNTGRALADRQVFAYDSGRMVRVQPLAEDTRLLQSLAASDDSGSRDFWLVFSLIRGPALLLLLVVGTWAYSRRDQTFTPP